MEFVGCLARPEELKKRVNAMVTLNRELGTGWGNLYTRLGHKAVSKSDGTTLVGSVIGNTRTFCNLPVGKSEARPFWTEEINDAAADETGAHMSEFCLFSFLIFMSCPYFIIYFSPMKNLGD